jgi:hypothetical protein
MFAAKQILPNDGQISTSAPEPLLVTPRQAAGVEYQREDALVRQLQRASGRR